MKASPLPDRLRYNILFENISDEVFTPIRSKLRERRYRASETILEDDSSGEELFLLAEGRVRIVKKGKSGEEKLLALLHPGDFFGELELVDGRPRSARVVALDDCLTYIMQKSDFERLLEESRPFATRILQVLSLRLRSLNSQFISELARSTQLAGLELSKLRRIIEATEVLNSTLDLDKLLVAILGTALKIVDADRGTVYLIDAAKRELWSKVVEGSEVVTIRLPLGKGIAGYVAATGDTLNIGDAYLDPRFNPEVDRKTGYRTNTILCMPMKNKEGKTIGVFQLLNATKGGFTTEDESLIAALSVHAAIAVENARLYEEEKALLRMREEVRLAAKIQQDLLPKTIPQIPGYDIACESIAAQTVGGDSYDCISVGPHRFAVCVGDVSGKGVPAAMLMANVQATLRALSMRKANARECVTASNTLLYHSTSPEKFVTLFYSILDAKRHQLQFANAGHNHPIVFPRRKDIYRLETGGIVLGIMEQFPFKQETRELKPGDVVVIFSDGIVEAMNAQGEQFGEERMVATVRKHPESNAAGLMSHVMTAVKNFTGNHPQQDDMTIVVLKRNGATGRAQRRSPQKRQRK